MEEMMNMESFSECMIEYRKQLQKGTIKTAYKGLMEYIMDLRTQFIRKFPDLAPGNIYHGYMDMTYFPLFPEALKSRHLKIAIVFNYDQFRFEIWLAGYNKQVQNEYWELFKESEWRKYRVVSTTKGVDSIIENVISDNPDFSNLDILTSTIENGTLSFIDDIENFLSNH
jgi:hypothetical protein